MHLSNFQLMGIAFLHRSAKSGLLINGLPKAIRSARPASKSPSARRKSYPPESISVALKAFRIPVLIEIGTSGQPSPL